MSRYFGSIVLCIAYMLTGTGCQERLPIAEKMTNPLQETLDQQQLELQIPGISAAVIFPDNSTWLGTSGKSSNSEAINSDMLFGLGSVTKTYIAALILQKGVFA